MHNLPAIIEPTPLRVVACANPFKAAHTESWLVPGESLLEILRKVQPDIARYTAHVWVGDTYIPREDWPTTYPAPGSEITIKVVPRGDVGRMIGAIVIAIAAIAATVLTAGLFAPGAFGMIMGGLAGLTVSMVGNLALNALIPPTVNPSRQAQLAGASDSPTYGLTAGSNSASKWNPFPKILGRHKVFPIYGAETYSEIVGMDQYLRLYFIWGISTPGHLIQIEDLKIVATALGEYEGLEIEHRNLRYKDPDGNITVYGDAPPALYTNDIHEDQPNNQLENDEPIVRTTNPGANEISIDFTNPSGLYFVDVNPKHSPGGKLSEQVNVKVEYRKYTEDGSETYALLEVLSWVGSTSSAIRYGKRWKVNPGNDPLIQYDVRVTKFGSSSDTNLHMGITYWTALRTIKYVAPVNAKIGLATTVLRIKASDEFSGTVGQFSGITSGFYPDWDKDTQTWIVRVTNNPASLFREMAQGPHLAEPFTDAEIDLEKIQYWHEFCEAQDFAYNKVIDYKVDFWEIMAEIAAAGRAAQTWTDSILSIIIDEPQEYVRGPAFTQRNSRNFSSAITYPVLPHGWRVAFKNELNDWLDDEYIVLDDGYQIDGVDAFGNAAPTLPPATIFEQLPLLGITHHEQIFKHARYHIACLRLRFEVHSLITSAEHLVATRGDRVKTALDVLLVGLAVGRVKALLLEIVNYDENGAPVYSENLAGVLVDEPPPLDDSIDCCIRFRLEDNTSFLVPTKAIYDAWFSFEYWAKAHMLDGEWPEESYAMQFAAPIPPPNAPGEYWPGVGDLWMFGESGKESLDCILNVIRPNSDLGAQLTLVPYVEAIYTADQGSIPDYDPKVAMHLSWPVPVIDSIRSDGSVLYRAQDGSWQSRILVTLRKPSGASTAINGIVAQFWPTGDPYVKTTLPTVSTHGWEISIAPVEDGKSYDFRLCYADAHGTRGPWTDIQTHVVLGKQDPPSTVQDFQVYQSKEVTNFSWDAIPDRDVAGYEIQYGSAGVTWNGTNSILLNRVTLGTSFATTLVVPGTWDFMIKAIDTSGNYSLVETRKNYMVMPARQTINRATGFPLWPGDRGNFVRDPLTGRLFPKDQNIPDGNDFDVFDHFVVNPYAEYVYIAIEVYWGEDRSLTAWCREYSDLAPGEAGAADPEMSFDYRTAAGVYGGFEKWSIAPFFGSFGKFKLTMTAANGLRTISDFETVIDQPL